MKEYVLNITEKARDMSYKLFNIETETKNKLLLKMAEYIIKEKDFIISENEKDISNAIKNKLNKSIIDRLTLNDKRLKEMSTSLKEIAELPDPINNIIKEWKRPNEMIIQKVRVPIGVVLVIYEARPNVTSDCIGLLLKSSNVAILRGGSDSQYSRMAIGKVLNRAVKDSGLDFQPFFIIDKTEREVVDLLLKETENIDLVIPRGGEALIRKVVEISHIPVIKHYKGICHIYIDEESDLEMALRICVNAKVQRPSVCNAVETILVHKEVASDFLPRLKKEFDEHEVEIRGDKKTRNILNDIKEANEEDWITEYLDLIVSIKVVETLDEAVSHINSYSSHHTESIITDNKNNADKFVKGIDSACCFINISTRFSDGYQFGLGAEIGISTDKLHARGPMGLEDLTTYKYVVRGDGQIRE